VKEWGKALSIYHMDLHRWSTLTNFYESLLREFRTITRTCYKRRKDCPIYGQHQAMVEQYSILSPLHTVLKQAQGRELSGPVALLGLNDLLAGGALDPKAPLFMVDPGRPVKPEERMFKLHKDLTHVARKTRQLLYEALYSRFIKGRYAEGMASSYIWDAAAMAHPAFTELKYVTALAPNEGKTLSGVLCRTFSLMKRHLPRPLLYIGINGNGVVCFTGSVIRSRWRVVYCWVTTCSWWVVVLVVACHSDSKAGARSDP
jgi:hypothetical protein